MQSEVELAKSRSRQAVASRIAEVLTRRGDLHLTREQRPGKSTASLLPTRLRHIHRLRRARQVRAYCIGRAGAGNHHLRRWSIGQVNRQTACDHIDRRNLPAPQGRLLPCRSVLTKHPSLSEGKVCDDRQRVIQGLVVAGRPSICRRIVEIDYCGVTTEGLKIGRSIVDRPRPDKRKENFYSNCLFA